MEPDLLYQRDSSTHLGFPFVSSLFWLSQIRSTFGFLIVILRRKHKAPQTPHFMRLWEARGLCWAGSGGSQTPCVFLIQTVSVERTGTEAHRARLLSLLCHREALTFTESPSSTLSASVAREEVMLKGLKGPRFGSRQTFSDSVFSLLWGVRSSLASSGNIVTDV